MKPRLRHLINYLVGKRHFVVGCCSLTVVERIAVGQTAVVPSFVVVVEPFEFAKKVKICYFISETLTFIRF